MTHQMYDIFLDRLALYKECDIVLDKWLKWQEKAFKNEFLNGAYHV